MYNPFTRVWESNTCIGTLLKTKVRLIKNKLISFDYSMIKPFCYIRNILERKRKMGSKKNLWILTEERPKPEVIGKIFELFAQKMGFACFINNIRILPILEEDGRFSFTYEVKGLDCQQVNRVFLKIVSGESSFMDFLVFYQDKQPEQSDRPILAIEETKTDDSESRNTGVYQRASKFVYIEYYYPEIDKYMLYNLQVQEKENPTDTNIFGTKCLLTLGVKIVGKEHNKDIEPFKTINELIEFKNNMRKPPKGNTPIEIIKVDENKIQVSGRLYKSGGLNHDPNIGALSLIAATLRALGWTGEIEITQHGLVQNHIKYNKFIKLAKRFNITLEGLDLPQKIEEKAYYWHYETESEKLGTIFIHIVSENFAEGMSIYENHAGCERGYFITKDGVPITVQKYLDKTKYKAGDKSQIIFIPDLVLIDLKEIEVINIEGKKYKNMEQGIKELQNFDAFEKFYIKKYYPEYKIIRTVVLYGGSATKIERIEVSFLLNKKGDLVLACKAPSLFKKAIKNLKDYWGV